MPTQIHAHALELKVPPVVLVLIDALMMWLGSAWFPRFDFSFPWLSIISWMIVLAGLITCALGILEFKRAKTTVNPTRPESSTALVRTGIYSHTRNPMYLGFLLILLGQAVLTGNVLAFLGLPAFLLYMNRFQVKPEERVLTSVFGDEFKAYCSTVPRWI